MAFIIIQLSDIHFSAEKDFNPLLDRYDELVGAVRAELSRDDECLLVFSGDIADRGKTEEYLIASEFIDMLYSNLIQHLGDHPKIAIVPGNHDHDFYAENYDEQLRNTLITSSTPSNPPSEKMHQILLQPQQPYRDFTKWAQETYGAFTVDNLYASHEFSIRENQIRMILLNSTRFTTIREQAGKSWFPVEELSSFLSGKGVDGVLSIGVFHHPYNWHHPDNASKLKAVVEEFCDVVFTGHEHRSARYLKMSKSTEQNLYVEGGVLQEHDRPIESTFNIIRIDPVRQTFHCKSISWNGDFYDTTTDESEHRYLRLRKDVRNDFDLTDDWRSWLEQVGTDFRHPRSRELTLSHLFVYPDLRKLDVKRSCKPSGLIRDREVLGYIQEKRRVLIAGHEKIGKTSLCKSLFRDLREAGIVPLILRSEFTAGNSKLAATQERLKAALNLVVEKTYITSSSTRFWHTPIENRAVLIDDYDRLCLSLGGRDSLLNWCSENFGIVVVTSDPGIRLKEVFNRSLDDTVLWTFEHADILESDRETRDALIGRWLETGHDPFDLSVDKL